VGAILRELRGFVVRSNSSASSTSCQKIYASRANDWNLKALGVGISSRQGAKALSDTPGRVIPSKCAGSRRISLFIRNDKSFSFAALREIFRAKEHDVDLRKHPSGR
jgi:hypothetical protein